MDQPTPTELETLLARAAQESADRGVDLERFMQAAWNAYVDTVPGFRARLEHMQTLAQLEAMRRTGRMGQA